MPAAHHFLFLLFLLFLSNFPPSTPQNITESTDPSYYYDLCSSSRCNDTPLPYPFGLSRYCRIPSVNYSCGSDGFIHSQARGFTGTYRIFGNLNSDSTGVATILNAADSLFSCGPVSAPDYAVAQSPFFLPNDITYGTHLNCTQPPASLAGLQPASCLRCSNGTDKGNVCYYSPGFVSRPECENFYVYLPLGFNVTAEKDLRGYLQKGFPTQYHKPEASGGSRSFVQDRRCPLAEWPRSWWRGVGESRKGHGGWSAVAASSDGPDPGGVESASRRGVTEAEAWLPPRRMAPMPVAWSWQVAEVSQWPERRCRPAGWPRSRWCGVSESRRGHEGRSTIAVSPDGPDPDGIEIESAVAERSRRPKRRCRLAGWPRSRWRGVSESRRDHIASLPPHRIAPIPVPDARRGFEPSSKPPNRTPHLFHCHSLQPSADFVFRKISGGAIAPPRIHVDPPLPEACQSCERSGGRCGAGPAGDFVCFCKASVHKKDCSDGEVEDLRTWFPNQGDSAGSASKKTLVIALSTSAAVLVLLVLAVVVVIFAFRRKRRTSLQDSESFSNNKAIAPEEFKDLVDGMAPTRYSYSQIKKFTNNFSQKLGEGGFGKIYKGVIHKKRHEQPVAVKVLKLSKQSEKQFMNEVATIGRIHHTNLVKMLGYCVERKKRALVYEYMENGSLDKYLKMTRHREHGNEVLEDESNREYCLGPKQMHTIALETATGILYLHEGCRSKILHCDIKPHNVLLDSNLSAKVSDFGLARMIDKDHSHISLTVAQGTPGYASPEMWSRSYGSITDKSDVYSFGILLLEMAGGRIKNESDPVVPSSQVHLPMAIVKHVKEVKLVTRSGDQGKSDQIEDGQMNEGNDEEIIARMCLVGLWCIQHIPSHRPSMSRVILMLKGSAEIEIPPDPFPHDEGNEQPTFLTTPTVDLSTVAETQ